jgi:hypothetical protein
MATQTVYYTNPSVISGLQSTVASLSGAVASLSGAVSGVNWNTISSSSWTAASNTNYIWNLPDTRSTGTSAIVTFPAAPVDGDFIEIVDGLGTWGNCLYTNVGLNMNGKALSGMTATGTVTNTSCQGGFRDYRKGSILFTYRAVNNTWYANGTVGKSMTSEYSEVTNDTENPWDGWWMFYTPMTVNTVVNGKANNGTFPTLNAGARSTSFAYVYFDTSTYPFTTNWYTGNTFDVTAAGAYSTRSYEYYTTGGVVDKTQIVSAYSQAGSIPFPPWQAASNSTNAQGCGFRLQSSNREIATITNLVIPDFQANTNAQYGLIIKLKSAPGYTQKAMVESSMDSFFNASDIGDQHNYDDMQDNFRKMCLEAIYQSNPQTQQIGGAAVGRFVYEKDPYFIGNTGPNGFNAGGIKAIEVMNEFLSTSGKTFVTPITNIIKSYSGAATVAGVPNVISIGSTEVTTIFTRGPSMCTPGSNITVSGLTGSWSRMNGYYPNGVSVWENNTRFANDPTQLDGIFTDTAYTGTITNTYNRFNLIYDSWSGAYEAQTTGAYLNYAINYNDAGNAIVSVTHRIYPTMGYNELFAAFSAFCNYVFGPVGHTRAQINYLDTYRANTVGRLATNWHLIGTNAYVQTGTQDSGFNSRPKETYCVPYLLNQRRGKNLFTWNMRNDPYNVGSILYNAYYQTGTDGDTKPSGFCAFNYMETGTSARLRVGIDGPLYKDVIYNTGYYQAVGRTVNLANLSYPGLTGGSTFVGKMFPAFGPQVTGSGGPNGAIPDWNYWIGPWAGSRTATTVDESIRAFERTRWNLNCGLIRPEYTVFEGYPGYSGAATGPRRIGYFNFNYTSNDLRFMITTAFSPAVDPANPTGPFNPKLATGTNAPYSAAFRNVYAAMMSYLMGPTGAGGLACDALIIDNRCNVGGGGQEGLEFASFFGGDRNGSKSFARKADDGFSALIDPDTLQFALNAQTVANQKSQSIITNDNAVNYPNAMYRGVGTSYTGARKLVILNSDAAYSNGVRAMRWFAGDNQDGKIGNNTIVKVIGSADTKFDGSTVTTAYQESRGDEGNTYINTYPYMQWQLEVPSYNMACQYVTPGSTGTLWYHKDYPVFGPTAPKNGFRGTCGTGAALPQDLQNYIYPAMGIAGAFAEQQAQFPNLYLPGKTEIPDITNQNTWRDPWLETAIYEAMVGVLPGEN